MTIQLFVFINTRSIVKKELLIRFANAACTKEEAMQVIAWLNQPGHEQLLEEIIEADLLEALQNNGVGERNELKRLLKQIPLNDPAQQGAYTSGKASQRYLSDKDDYGREDNYSIKRKRNRTAGLLKIAASLLLLAMLSFMIWNMRDSKQGQLTFTREIKENTNGRKSIIYLPDGSIVHLNSNSKISYVKSFSDTLRAIDLEGEAYFEVAKDNFRPFVVQTGHIAIKALGTAFNVKNYADEPQIYVALKTGRVLVSGNNTPSIERKDIFLDPGKEVRYNKSTESFTSIEVADAKESFGWKDGIIYFKHADFRTVLDRLEAWYGVQFEIKNKPQYKWSYTAEFQNQTLQDVLKSIGFSQNFTYTINDKYVEIIFANNQQ